MEHLQSVPVETGKKPVYHINTAAGEAAARKGHASYPEDFPRLRPGEDFVAWRVDGDWEIETTLDGAALFERLEALHKRGEIIRKKEKEQ